MPLAEGSTLTFAPGSITTGCPRCGTSYINNASEIGYVTVGGIAALIKALQPTGANRHDWERLADICGSAQGVSAAQLADEIEKQLPIFGELSAFLRSGVWQGAAIWLTLLVAVVLGALDHTSHASTPSQVTNVTINIEPPTEAEVARAVDQARLEHMIAVCIDPDHGRPNAK